jgi:DNA-binding NarL/FixJ family response regulator
MKGRFVHRNIVTHAAGYLLKQMRGADLVGAVRTVAAGLMRLANRTRAQIMMAR